jgi:hypothetical protein
MTLRNCLNHFRARSERSASKPNAKNFKTYAKWWFMTYSTYKSWTLHYKKMGVKPTKDWHWNVQINKRSSTPWISVNLQSFKFFFQFFCQFLSMFCRFCQFVNLSIFCQFLWIFLKGQSLRIRQPLHFTFPSFTFNLFPSLEHVSHIY